MLVSCKKRAEKKGPHGFVCAKVLLRKVAAVEKTGKFYHAVDTNDTTDLRSKTLFKEVFNFSVPKTITLTVRCARHQWVSKQCLSVMVKGHFAIQMIYCRR